MLAAMYYTGGDNHTCYNLSSGPGPRTGVDVSQSYDRDYQTQAEKDLESDDRKYGGLDIVYGADKTCDEGSFPPNKLRIKLFCDRDQHTPQVSLYKVNK
jgi:hypothetical protein